MKRREEQEQRWDRARRRRMSIIKSKEVAKETLEGSPLDIIGKVWSKLGL